MPSNANIFALDPIISLNLSSSSHPFSSLRIWIWTRWVGDAMRCRVALSLVTASGNSTPSCWSCEPSFTSMHSAGLGRWIAANGTPDGTLSSFEVSLDFMRFHHFFCGVERHRNNAKHPKISDSSGHCRRLSWSAGYTGRALQVQLFSNFQLMLTWSIIWVQPLCKIICKFWCHLSFDFTTLILGFLMVSPCFWDMLSDHGWHCGAALDHPQANRPIPRPFRSASRSASARSVFSSLFSTMEPGTLKPNLHSFALSMLDEWWVEHVERNQLWTWMFIVVPTPHFFQRAMRSYVTCVDRISSDMNIHDITWQHIKID